MGRAPCCDKNGLKKGPWTVEEDQKSPHYKEQGRAQEQNGQERVRWSPDEDKRLAEYIDRHGETSSWKNVPTRAGLSRRSPKSCRLRWNSKLKPSINQKPFSEEEEATIIELQKQHGNKWATIAKCLPGRTDTGIKNFWNNHLKKKFSKKEIPSPITQTPWHQLIDTADLLTCALNDPRDEVSKLHSDASFAWNPRHGHGFHPTDEELLTSPSPLPPQTPSFNYQQTMEDPQVCTRNPDGIGSRPANIPNASSIPPPVSASLEPSKADQVEEIVEGTPADQEIANRYSSTSTTFEAWITDLKDNENNDDLGSEDIPLASIFSDWFRPEDISVDSIFN
ncbi:hypothetical protein AAG906_005345 [Vitis piasezkii]